MNSNLFGLHGAPVKEVLKRRRLASSFSASTVFIPNATLSSATRAAILPDLAPDFLNYSDVLRGRAIYFRPLARNSCLLKFR
jgi:hypothetical protein